MKRSDWGIEDPVSTGHCDYCREEVSAPISKTSSLASDRCISCGKQMDLNVYYTMCPHCGFNYRIQISPRIRKNVVSFGALLRALIVLVSLLLSGYVFLWFALA